MPSIVRIIPRQFRAVAFVPYARSHARLPRTRLFSRDSWKKFPAANGFAEIETMPLIPIMLAVNLPLGYAIVRYFQIRAFWKIFLIGLGQYVASAFILAALLVFTDNSPQNNTKITEHALPGRHGDDSLCADCSAVNLILCLVLALVVRP